MPSPQTITLDVRIPEIGTLYDFEVEVLGNGLYRIVEVPFGPGTPGFNVIEYQDIVELAMASDGIYELRSVRARSRWRRFDFVLSFEYEESEAFANLLSRVEESGGTWVREAEGLLSIFLPPDSVWDPSDAVVGQPNA